MANSFKVRFLGGFMVTKNNIFWHSTNGCKCAARVTKWNVKYDCFRTCLPSDSHTPKNFKMTKKILKMP